MNVQLNIPLGELVAAQLIPLLEMEILHMYFEARAEYGSSANNPALDIIEIASARLAELRKQHNLPESEVI